jgi:pimeloyl-[acyl-carrier protein] methyl ester esterase
MLGSHWLFAAAAAAVLTSSKPACAEPPRLFEHSRVVTTDRISVEVIGKGPDVVLIPGLASSRAVWRATAERLKARYRLHLVQVAGFAGEPSRANAAGPVFAPTAQAIDDYIVAARLAPAVVVGHSMGGTIALWLAEHHPDHVKKVMLVDALPWVATVFISPNVNMQTATAVAEHIRTGPPQSEADQVKTNKSMMTKEADQATVLAWEKAGDQHVIQAALADDMELDLRPGLAAIKTPVTVLYPDYTPLGVPPGATDGRYGGAFAALPGVKLKRVDHSLHFIMFDQPQAFAADLDAFLAG